MIEKIICSLCLQGAPFPCLVPGPPKALGGPGAAILLKWSLDDDLDKYVSYVYFQAETCLLKHIKSNFCMSFSATQKLSQIFVLPFGNNGNLKKSIGNFVLENS